MYPNLPLMVPTWVRASLPAALAMPKSMIFTSPSKRDQHVLRRDVAMHHAERPAASRPADGARSRALRQASAMTYRTNSSGSGSFEGSGAIEEHAQIFAVHELEREVVAEVDLADIVDLGDVGVIELARDGGLVAEHLDELFVLGDRGRMRLMATRRRCARSWARNTSAIPPMLMRSVSS